MQQGSGRSMLADIAVRVRARLGDLGFCGCFVSKLVFWLAWGPGSWLVYHRSCAWVHAMGPGTDPLALALWCICRARASLDGGEVVTIFCRWFLLLWNTLCRCSL